jgi:hypothetical protein
MHPKFAGKLEFLCNFPTILRKNRKINIVTQKYFVSLQKICIIRSKIFTYPVRAFCIPTERFGVHP